MYDGLRDNTGVACSPVLWNLLKYFLYNNLNAINISHNCIHQERDGTLLTDDQAYEGFHQTECSDHGKEDVGVNSRKEATPWWTDKPCTVTTKSVCIESALQTKFLS
jgi:hypothetical protein